MEKPTRHALYLSGMILLAGLATIVGSNLISTYLNQSTSHLPTQLATWIDIIFLLLLAMVVFFLSRAGMRKRDKALLAVQENLEHFAHLFDSSSVAHMSIDKDANILSINDVWCKTTGYERSDVVGSSFASLLLPPYRDNFFDLYVESLKEGEINGVLLELLSDSGEALLLEMHGRLISPGQNEPFEFKCILRDLTKQFRLRHSQQTSDLRYKTLIESANDAIFILERDIILEFNDKARELFEAEGNALLGMSIEDISTPVQKDGKTTKDHEAEILEALSEEGGIFFRWTHQTLKGRVFEAEVSLTVLPGEKYHSLGIMRDISDRLREQRALREAEERFRLAFKTSPDAININRLRDGLYVAVNDGFVSLSGYEEAEAIGKTTQELDIWVNPEDREEVLRQLAAKGQLANMEILFRTKDNQVMVGLMSATVIEINNEPHAITITRNINDLKLAERSQREVEEKYRILVENSLDGIYLIQDFELVFCNRELADMLQFDSPQDLIGNHIKDYISDKSWPTVEDNLYRRMRGELNELRYELFMKRKDGSDLEVEAYGSRITYQGKPAIQGVMRDISERKQMQRQLDQASRLESIGRLAGGVAHDFNNLLTAIVGHAELGLYKLDENDPFRRELEEILAISQRGANLTQQLLTFSRNQVLKPKNMHLRDIVHDLERMLQRVLGEDIQMKLNLANDDWPVLVDHGQIDQTIVNLCINARDAMPNGGTLNISLKNQTVENAPCYFHAENFSGDFVMLEISDTGTGMEEEVLKNIFDAFFTTKPVGKGTGLGLSTVYGAVSHSGGHIQVTSELGEGTSFRLYFPRSLKAAEKPASQESSESVSTGNERLLLVEDDGSVRKTVVKALRARGFDIVAAESGVEALEILDTLHPLPDLIISDVVMPEMRGPEMAARIRQSHPDIPILLMSGYRDRLEEGDEPLLDIPFLQKPFRIEELLQKVRSLLDGRKN